MTVNNGQQINISGATAASSGTNYIPQSPAAADNPGWDPANPSANTFAPGINYIEITPAGQHQAYQFQANLPINVNWSSLQFYIFWNNSDEVSWMALNSGDPVAGSISPATAKAVKDV